MIRINDHLLIDEDEIRFTYSCSPGPGGQNVNKVATKATLLFDVAGSPSLSEDQRLRIHKALATRLTKTGVLRIVRARHRTQSANRRDAMEQLVALLAEALRPRRARKKTRPSRAAVKRRLEQKAKRSRLKQQRRGRFAGDADS